MNHQPTGRVAAPGRIGGSPGASDPRYGLPGTVGVAERRPAPTAVAPSPGFDAIPRLDGRSRNRRSGAGRVGRDERRPTPRPKGPRGTRSARSTTGRRIRRTLYVLFGLLVVGPFVAFAIGWMIFEVPTADDTTATRAATFTFADATTPVATVRPENINRTPVTLDQVPVHVRNAVLAAEDRTFYSNPGFDITGIGRAVYSQLTGGGGGGSTITQQYIKVSTGEDENSLWRKYKEVVLAVKISREQTKDQILENYLNAIYLGRGAYGFQAASQAYFGKDVGDLTVSEGAMLAGIIQSPSRWDPRDNLAKSQERWGFALDGMVESGWLTPADRAQQVFPGNWDRAGVDTGGVFSDDRYHIYEQALGELKAQGISQDTINTRGLTITTTVDVKRQIAAVDAMKDVLGPQPDNLRAALVSVDPRTGAIQAYYGGANGLGTDYAQALRQPGSTFKPFVLTAALQSDQGIGLGTEYDGSSPQEFEGGVTVDNSEGVDCAQCTVQFAMTKSINTVFYRMALDVGTRNVIEAAHEAGIPENLLPEARGGIALGDQEVHPVDMAAAFGTFAADGNRHQPYLVAKVVAADGEVLFEHQDAPGDPAIDSQVARNVTEAMIGVAASSKIELDAGRPVAVKTGTVQRPGSTTGENKDAWTVGYTPSLSTAVWVGTDQSDAIKTSDGRNVFGRLLPGAIWQNYMKAALKGTPKEQFSDFDPLGTPLDAAEDGPVEEGAPGGQVQLDQDDRNRDDRGDDRPSLREILEEARRSQEADRPGQGAGEGRGNQGQGGGQGQGGAGPGRGPGTDRGDQNG